MPSLLLPMVFATFLLPFLPGGVTSPVTLPKFTLNGAGGIDFYDICVVGSNNMPRMVSLHVGTGCAADLNEDCPGELKIIDGIIEGVACKSACDAFGEAQYCSSGAYASPDTCKPSTYSEFFKNACLQAYSYAYDDGTSTFTCASADYITTFCPGLSTRSSAETNPSSTASTSGTSHAVPRNHRRLLGKVPDVNFRSPPATSNGTSRNLDKEDPPSPPAPTGNGRSHP